MRRDAGIIVGMPTIYKINEALMAHDLDDKSVTFQPGERVSVFIGSSKVAFTRESEASQLRPPIFLATRNDFDQKTTAA